MRAEKQLLLDEIKDKIAASNAFLVTKYTGLGATEANSFRKSVTAGGGEFEVVKKRMFAKAASLLGIELNVGEFEGHVGVIFSQKDPLELTKAVFKYGQDHDKIVSVIAARLDDRFYLAADVERLAKLPSKQEMRAQFLGLLEAPMAQTLAVMEALIASVAHCLDQKAKQQD